MNPYYEHAGITIYHGDCQEILPVLRVEAVVTDPPYGMNYDTNGGRSLSLYDPAPEAEQMTLAS